MDYIGDKCPVCKKYFHADDDIVVCPDCGTPHHRECYDFIGQCANSELHGAGYDYASDADSHKDHAKATVKYCSRCGKENDADAFYCNSCGTPLNNNQAYGANTPPFGSAQNFSAGRPFDMPYMDPLGGVQSDLDLGDGVTAGECAKYVKQNTPYYSRVFANIKSFNKSKFNFAAALFSGGYLLYRKMYKLGALITSLEVLMLALRAMLVLKYKDIFLLSYSSDNYVNALMNKISSYNQLDMLLISMPAMLYFSIIVIKIVMGFTFNRMYFKHCRTQINSIKSNAAEGKNPETILQTKGGVNIALAISAMIAVYIVYYIPELLISFGSL